MDAEYINDNICDTIPLVSVCCITFNHVDYIRDALDGFLMQKTSFPYEIVIHDDASTDGTQDIIKEYAARYPGIIRPILQKENQWSKGAGVKVVERFLWPEVRGRYIAVSEGDDFWTDPEKLQKQVSYMEEHPQCSMTFHAARYITDGGECWNEQHEPEERDVSLSEILYGGGFYCPTASLVFRTCYALDIPRFRVISEYVGDYVWQLLFAAKGTVHYYPEKMCTYRYLSAGSYSANLLSDRRILARNTQNRVEVIREFEQWSMEKHPFEEALLIIQNYGVILGCETEEDEQLVEEAFCTVIEHIRNENGIILAMTQNDIASTCELALLMSAFRKERNDPIFVYVQRDYQKYLLRACDSIDGFVLGGPYVSDIIRKVMEKFGDVFLNVGISEEMRQHNVSMKQLLGLKSETLYKPYQLGGRFKFQDDVNEDILPQEIGVTKGKTIFLFPGDLGKDNKAEEEVWSALIDGAKSKGYDIIVNSDKECFWGEKTVYQRIDHTIRLAEYCGFVVGVGPMLSAINAFTDTQVYELCLSNSLGQMYNSENWHRRSVYDVLSHIKTMKREDM